MKVNELRSMSSEEIGQKEKALKKELFELKYQRKIGRVEKPSRFKLIKRDIARALTVLNEKKNEHKNK